MVPFGVFRVRPRPQTARSPSALQESYSVLPAAGAWPLCYPPISPSNTHTAAVSAFAEQYLRVFDDMRQDMNRMYDLSTSKPTRGMELAQSPSRSDPRTDPGAPFRGSAAPKRAAVPSQVIRHSRLRFSTCDGTAAPNRPRYRRKSRTSTGSAV